MLRRKKSCAKKITTQRTFPNIESLENRVVLTGTLGLDAPVDVGHAELSRAVPRIVNGEQTSDYKAVGLVNGGCTGTLISPTHVLTAAHCVENEDGSFMKNTQGTFEVEGQTYKTVKIVPHPEYHFSEGGDLAIMELDRPVSGVTPMEILRTAPHVGQMLTLVGFGEGGTSTGGYDPNDDGKQVGQTRLDGLDDNQITWNFDSHDEANTAPGDSGGPALVNVGGKQLIAGVTSGGAADAHTLGDFSFDTRVDVHADWIDSIVNGTNPDPGNSGNPDAGGNPDPGGPGGGIQELTQEEKKELADEELEVYDKDGDGKLSKEELIPQLTEIGESQDEAEMGVQEWLDDYDKDGDGALSRDEIIASYGPDETDPGGNPDPGGPEPGGNPDPVVGDINGDGVFNSADVIAMFQSGHFEDGIDSNSTLADGDMNGDGDVNVKDLLFAFQHAKFVSDAEAPGDPVDDGDDGFDDEDNGFDDPVDEWDEGFADEDIDWGDDFDDPVDEWDDDFGDRMPVDEVGDFGDVGNVNVDDAWADDETDWCAEAFVL